MKVKMHKHSMTRYCQESEVELLKSAGWQIADTQELSNDPIVVRPTVKSKGTVKVTLDNANQQGDE
jgi:hypothetical protein